MTSESSAPESPPARRIAHLDMDAFYASVELLRYPQLKGLPVVIGGGRRSQDDALAKAYDGALASIPLAQFPRLKDYVGRGVITTATYAARQFGVGSAMGLMKAARLCPDAILLPVDFAQYRRYSQAFKHIILALAPVMEDHGVDEVYIDFTQAPGGLAQGGRELAQTLQQRIAAQTGLSCSIGIAPNKLLAKMASEFDKPGGISVLWPHDLGPRIWPLSVRKINGIGPKSEAKLAALGLHTIGELAAYPREALLQQFGKAYGAWMHEAAWGRDERPVVTESEPVSISRETTFDRDLHAVRDRAELGQILTTLCNQLAQDLQRKGYVSKTLGIKLRYDNFKIVTRDLTRADPTAQAQEIRHSAGLCLKRVDLSRRIRLLGVRAGSLSRPLPAGAEAETPLASTTGTNNPRKKTSNAALARSAQRTPQTPDLF